MPVKQGSMELLEHPASQELLRSKIPARLAYVWTDGTPRVVPIWFHWNGQEFVLGSPTKAPKLKALARNPRVALTIDDNQFPHKVLLVRGRPTLEPVSGIVPEYAMAAERYFGQQQGRAWVAQPRFDGSGHGADHHQTPMDRAAGFRDALSERPAPLSQAAKERLSAVYTACRGTSPCARRFSRESAGR
jgi:hypothetical protein